MTGTLIIPRCEIKWGKVNLSSYDGNGDFPQNEPLAFNAEVHLESQNTAPTGSFSWNPAGKAFKIYEKLVIDNIKDIITTRFFYDGGKTITFLWVWSGQSVSFGNDMSIKISLATSLSGLVNTNQRNINQVYDKPSSGLQAAQALPNLYGIDPKLIAFNGAAETDMKKYKINNHYAKDSTFGSSFNNIAQQNGNFVTPSNIGEAKMIVFPPFSWDKTVDVKDGAKIPRGQNPDPKDRYGYLLGPSVINSLQRSAEFPSPQQTQTSSPATQTRAAQRPDKTNSGTNRGSATPAPQQTAQDQSKKKTKAALGTSGAAANPGINNANNPDGPKKQQILQNENVAKLQFQTYMTPVLVGIKPNDIVYVPSLTGEYIEDWIVQSVDYQQSDGAVQISVSATRVFGIGNLMNATGGKKFESLAKALKTLEDWDKYAWSLSRGQGAATTTSTPVLPVPKTAAEQSRQEFSTTRTANLA
jgi:hypothetical protein